MGNADLQIARAANQNAGGHLRAARLLHGAGLYGQAQGLAILGLEETGKAI